MGAIQAPEAIKIQYNHFSKVASGGFGDVFRARDKSTYQEYYLLF